MLFRSQCHVGADGSGAVVCHVDVEVEGADAVAAVVEVGQSGGAFAHEDAVIPVDAQVGSEVAAHGRGEGRDGRPDRTTCKHISY